MPAFCSWGNYPATAQHGVLLANRHSALPVDQGSLLPFGNGRSYGDVCLNPGGAVVGSRQLNRFMAFDESSGVLRCEAGILLADILHCFVPKGWFLPVTPGTKYVSVGGAIANDVHGKNHHAVGTFGCFVEGFELLRTDGSRQYCSLQQNEALYRASIGGMGLTGFITWADIRLRRVSGSTMNEETIRFSRLDDFFSVSADSASHEYTVAWVDCAASGESLGRGLFMRANHADTENIAVKAKQRSLSVPVMPPVSLVNNWSLRAFNALYYRAPRQNRVSRQVHYDPYFYPLDSIANWNRMYGPKGFLQYQCAIPTDAGKEAIRAILKRIANSGTGSFLAVLKVFGDIASPGLVSFPMPGVTLALDFPNHGEKTQMLFKRLDEIVDAAGGRFYSAKDAHVSAQQFQAAYPAWEQLEALRDPGIMSGFWARVSGKAGD
ncbi:MAG TPA: FAD-binding oxidoreductase [Pseudomonadales bacterium]